MGENSKIEWTTHTFNPWIGCQKVSPGCDNCYDVTIASIENGWVRKRFRAEGRLMRKDRPKAA